MFISHEYKEIGLVTVKLKKCHFYVNRIQSVAATYPKGLQHLATEREKIISLLGRVQTAR